MAKSKTTKFIYIKLRFLLFTLIYVFILFKLIILKIFEKSLSDSRGIFPINYDLFDF